MSWLSTPKRFICSHAQCKKHPSLEDSQFPMPVLRQILTTSSDELPLSIQGIFIWSCVNLYSSSTTFAGDVMRYRPLVNSVLFWIVEVPETFHLSYLVISWVVWCWFSFPTKAFKTGGLQSSEIRCLGYPKWFSADKGWNQSTHEEGELTAAAKHRKLAVRSRENLCLFWAVSSVWMYFTSHMY